MIWRYVTTGKFLLSPNPSLVRRTQRSRSPRSSAEPCATTAASAQASLSTSLTHEKSTRVAKYYATVVRRVLDMEIYVFSKVLPDRAQNTFFMQFSPFRGSAAPLGRRGRLAGNGKGCAIVCVMCSGPVRVVPSALHEAEHAQRHCFSHLQPEVTVPANPPTLP